VSADRLDVETFRAVDRAAHVADGDDSGALLRHQPRRDAAHVAEALDGDPALAQVHAEMARGILDGVYDALSRRFGPTFGAAEGDRLAGDHGRDGVADVHRIRVHNPGHRLGIGVDVRSRDVPLGADQDGQLRGEAAGQALEFAQAELARVDHDSALAATERHADDGAFPGHPHRQGLDLVEVDVLVVPDAALRGAARKIVLDAVAGEDLDLAVVHLHREVDYEGSLRFPQHLAQAGRKLQAFGRQIELTLGHVPRVDLCDELLCRHRLETLHCRDHPRRSVAPGAPKRPNSVAAAFRSARRAAPLDRSTSVWRSPVEMPQPRWHRLMGLLA
jgi:hypothetical protein